MISLSVPSDIKVSMAKFCRDLMMAINKDMSSKIGKTEAVGSVLLVSPSRKVYSVTVADDGTLTATLVNG